MKTNTITIRILALVLMLCTVCATLAACGGTSGTSQPSGGNATGAPEATQPPVTTAKTDENGYLLDDLDDVTLNTTFRILGCSEQKAQYYAAEKTNDLVSNAIYERNLTVEERLGVEFEWTFEKGNWSNRSSFVQKIQSTSAGGDAYDATMCYNLIPYVMAVQGLAENLYDTEYIDFTAPWWPSVYMNEALLNDTIFGLVESCSKGTLRNMCGVFFNNELLEARQMTSPYDMVAANEWTFDNMMALIKDSYQDLNDNGKKDKGDFFGVSTGTQPKMDSWFYGMGYRMSALDGDGNLQLLLGDPSITEAVETLNKAINTQDFYRYDENTHGDMFVEERAILYMTSILLADSRLKDLEINYGIVPTPKRTSEQENYINHVSNSHDAWAIPVSVDSKNNSSAVIECMASEAYRQVDPVYFETCIKLRYAPDERLGAMYDLIRDSITFDFVYLFSASMASPANTTVRNCIYNGTAWTTQWASLGGSYESEFAKILTLYGVQ
ncbi:MAG: hypothetical protein IJX28_03930 [Clostridia bacterium]|nr:hypothetical protein [Clostridia bacterium]